MAGAVIFVAGSLLKAEQSLYRFGMGLLGCGAVVLLMLNTASIHICGKLLDRLGKYTMPVFLMHTIFAAGMRAVLMKFGVQSSAAHVAVGLAVSFIGPVFAAEVMKRFKLDILLYPGKYIRLLKKAEG